MAEQEKDPALMTEAEQMQANYDRQQEVAKRKPVPHRPDVGTEQGEHNVPQEELDNRERLAGQQAPATVTGTAGGSATPRKQAAPKAGPSN